jgi:hypothetical protein
MSMVLKVNAVRAESTMCAIHQEYVKNTFSMKSMRTLPSSIPSMWGDGRLSEHVGKEEEICSMCRSSPLSNSIKDT